MSSFCLRHTSNMQTANLMSDNISHAFSHRVSGIPKKSYLRFILKKRKRKNSSFISVLYILICYLFNSNFTRTASFGSLEWLSGCQMSLPVFLQTVITRSGLSTLWNPLHILVSLLNPRELSDSGRVRIGRTDTGLKSKIRLRAGESIR